MVLRPIKTLAANIDSEVFAAFRIKHDTIVNDNIVTAT